MRTWLAFGAAAMVAAAFGVAALFAAGSTTLLMNAAWTVAAAAGAVAATIGAGRAPESQRQTWRLIALGAWVWLLGQIVWNVETLVAAPGFPTSADLLWLLSPLCGICALFQLRPAGGPVRRVLELDAVAVMLGIAALAVAWLYVPVAESGLGVTAKASALAYAFLYGALIVLWIDALAATPDVRRHRGPLVALAGIALNTAAWVAYSYDVLDGRFSAGRMIGLLWVLGQLAIGAGALLAARDAEIVLAEPLDRLRRRTLMPECGFVALVGSLIAFGALERPLGARIVLQIGVLLLGCVLIARNRLAAREAGRIQRQSTRLLEARNGELDVFAQAASHDLKAPLVSIQGLTDALARSVGDNLDARGRLYVERIQANAVTMQTLIDDLLEFARVGIDEAAEPIDADRIARAAVAEACSRTAGTAIELLTPIPPVHAHPVRFKQALVNLIDNADRYGRSAVRVSARSFVDSVEVVVEDDGPGIPPAEQERVFEIFSRGRLGIEVAPSGSGFGLALVRKIADSSGGSVRYEDVPTTGARFVLTFPKGAA